MKSYAAPLEDMAFLLCEHLRIPDRTGPGGYVADAETIGSVLAEAARFVEEEIAPLNATGDREGCRFHDGEVTTPPGFRQAFGRLRALGWPLLTVPAKLGGQAMPRALGMAFNEMIASASMAFGMFPGLTRGVADMIAAYGDEELQRQYLPKLLSCECTGTICMTEAQAGSDLSLVRTLAVPAQDGSYLIRGDKIFISGGDHDLTDNIVHLVLARTPDAPAGSKGLSLFIVPKFLPQAGDEIGVRNPVHTTGIETKMGNHASPTCALRFEDARGFLLGPVHGAMGCLFAMLNKTRIGSGLQGCAVSEAAYQTALSYARERRQGRPLGPNSPNGDSGTVAIISHPDVKRTLAEIRSFVEGGRALCYRAAVLLDTAAHHSEAGDRKRAERLLAIMTPVIKAFLTEAGFNCAVMAQQVLGGHGYIVGNMVEQYVRDARLGMLYEGANGIQGLDLAMRKIRMDEGRALAAFLAEAANELETSNSDEWLGPLARVLDLARACSDGILKAEPDQVAMVAGDYLRLLGFLAMGTAWAAMGRTARAHQDEGSAFHADKLATCRFFICQVLPGAEAPAARIMAGLGVSFAVPCQPGKSAEGSEL
ncbi:MAG: acyl-CoA dehydrogenase [Nitratireductor sp.]|nr:acyl-CoA dehydrogenase [Nitratireductor sp.]